VIALMIATKFVNVNVCGVPSTGVHGIVGPTAVLALTVCAVGVEELASEAAGIPADTPMGNTDAAATAAMSLLK
jgi:hypothetical protein